TSAGICMRGFPPGPGSHSCSWSPTSLCRWRLWTSWTRRTVAKAVLGARGRINLRDGQGHVQEVWELNQKTLVGTRIAVLDKGYVRLVDFMGSDLSVVNAARASFAKESKEFGEKDERLLDFLMREEHTSPLRHCFVTFEVKAPLFVARQ